MRYFEAQQANGGKLIVVDPRRTPTAQWATRHLSLRPGSDAALANGLLHVLVRDGLIDEEYIRGGRRASTTRSASRRRTGRSGSSGSPACRSGVIEAARALGAADRDGADARGPEQQAQGVNNTLAYINLALALGNVGKPFSGYGTFTGQGNGQGGREHGQKADQLPGYRRIDDPRPRTGRRDLGCGTRRRFRVRAGLPYELIDSIGTDGGIRALLVMGSNIAGLGAQRGPGRAASEGARLSRRRRLLPLRDGEPGRRRAAVGAVGRRGRHDDQPRRPRHPAPPRGRSAGRRADRHRHPLRRSRRVSAKRHQFAFHGSLATCSTSCAGRPAVHRRTIPASRYERIEARRRRVLAVSERGSSGTPRLFADGFPTPSGRARFHGVPHQSPADDPRRRIPAAPDDRPLARALPVRHADAACRANCHKRHRNRSPRCTRRPRGCYGLSNGARVTLTTRRADGHLHAQADARDSRGHGLRAVSLGRRAVDQSPDERRARSARAACRSSRCAPFVSAPSSRTRTRERETALVVIGNGMAGARLVEDVLARGGGERFDMTVFGDEPCGNYNRILLSSVLAGSHEPKRHLHQPAVLVCGQRRRAACRRPRRARSTSRAKRVVWSRRNRRAVRHAGDRDRQQPVVPAAVCQRPSTRTAVSSRRLRLPHARRLRAHPRATPTACAGPRSSAADCWDSKPPAAC